MQALFLRLARTNARTKRYLFDRPRRPAGWGVLSETGRVYSPRALPTLQRCQAQPVKRRSLPDAKCQRQGASQLGLLLLQNLWRSFNDRCIS